MGLNYRYIEQLLYEQFFNNKLVHACDENFKKKIRGDLERRTTTIVILQIYKKLFSSIPTADHLCSRCRHSSGLAGFSSRNLRLQQHNVPGLALEVTSIAVSPQLRLLNYERWYDLHWLCTQPFCLCTKF